ncbi:hypothetical protein [Pontibacter rugosus]
MITQGDLSLMVKNVVMQLEEMAKSRVSKDQLLVRFARTESGTWEKLSEYIWNQPACLVCLLIRSQSPD